MVSPQTAFTLFNNSTDVRQMAATAEGRKALPCLLEDMLYSEYQIRAQGGLPPLHYRHEHYYFQGPLLDDTLHSILRLPTLNCSGERSWNRAKPLNRFDSCCMHCRKSRVVPLPSRNSENLRASAMQL